MKIGDTIDITIAPNGKRPLYRMDITEISEIGVHGHYRCNFDEGWGDYVRVSDGIRGIGLIPFSQIKKVELIQK